MPSVSVIVPVFNTEKYLSKCIESIIKQSYKDLEILLVDDGSADNSLNICQNYAKQDSRIKVLAQKNQGPSVARNNALSIAEGEYICFVDSDDYISENTVENALKNMSDDVGMVIWGVNVFSEDNLSYSDWFNDYLNFEDDGITELTTEKKFQISVVPWNKMFRHNIIKKYNIDFPAGRLYEDNAFWWKYTMFCPKAYFMRDKLHYYNLRLSSLRGNVNNKKREIECDRIYMVENVYNFCVQNNVLETNRELLKRLLIHTFKAAYEATSEPNTITLLTYNLIKKMNFSNIDNSDLINSIPSLRDADNDSLKTIKYVLQLTDYAKNTNLNNSPGAVNSVFGIFRTLYNAGKADEIIQTVKLFIAKYPNNLLFIQLLGDTYHFLKNDIENALICYKKCAELKPDNAVIYGLISDIYGQKRDVFNQLLYKQKELNV